MQATALESTKLDRADLAGAVITNTKGEILQQYYDENGKLTPLTSIRYPAGKFPAASSFSDKTICPNGRTYGTNVADGLSIADMMVILNPPTRWSPPGARSLGSGVGRTNFPEASGSVS